MSGFRVGCSSASRSGRLTASERSSLTRRELSVRRAWPQAGQPRPLERPCGAACHFISAGSAPPPKPLAGFHADPIGIKAGIPGRVQLSEQLRSQRGKGPLTADAAPRATRRLVVAVASLELSGGDPSEPARLAVPLPANGERKDYLRATLAYDAEGRLSAKPIAAQDSSLTKALARADALLIREVDAPPAAVGEPCRVIALAPLGA